MVVCGRWWFGFGSVFFLRGREVRWRREVLLGRISYDDGGYWFGEGLVCCVFKKFKGEMFIFFYL